MTFRKLIEGKKFHPIDVFNERWVITDGKEIFGEDGKIRTIKQFKDDMKKIKRHDQYDDIYFPTEDLAKKALKDAKFEGVKVQKLSYT